MPPRKAPVKCDCLICNGKVVGWNVWYSHQALQNAASASSGMDSLHEVNGKSNNVTSGGMDSLREVHGKSDNVWDLLPPDSACTESTQTRPKSPKSLDDELAIARNLYREAKRERNRHTEKAKVKLDYLLEKAEEILTSSSNVSSHEHLDELRSRAKQIRFDARLVSRETPSLDRIRMKINEKLTTIECILPKIQSKLGKNINPIYVQSDETKAFSVIEAISFCLALCLSLFFGLSRAGCDFILLVIKILMVSVVSTLGLDQKMIGFCVARAEEAARKLPLTMKTVFDRFAVIIDNKNTFYATCPSCSYISPPNSSGEYPNTCTWRMHPLSSPCNADLLNSKGRPIRPFILPDIHQYISRLLSDKNLENLIDAACQDGLKHANADPPDIVTSPFQATFLRNFKGPDNQSLFIDGGPNGEARLVFSLNSDGFNVNRNTHRGATTTSGVICLACLNLPPDIRYHPEYMFVAVVPGPKEPKGEQMDHFLQPVTEAVSESFYRGIKLTSTGNYPNGRVVRSIIGPIVCDLPAARKVSGLANYNSNGRFCTCCSHLGKDEHGASGKCASDHPELSTAINLCGIDTLKIPSATAVPGNLSGWHEEEFRGEDAMNSVEDKADEMKLIPSKEPTKWTRRAVVYMKKQAYAYRKLSTRQERNKFWEKFGVRSSKLWDLPCWNPVMQLVIDPMHTLLEGVIRNHFRKVVCLCIEPKKPKKWENDKSDKRQPKSDKSLQTFDIGIDLDNDPKVEEEIIQYGSSDVEKVKKAIRSIIGYLTEPITDDEEARCKLEKRLQSLLKPALFFMAVRQDLVASNSVYEKMTKQQLARIVAEWRMNEKPQRPDRFVVNTLVELRKIQSVISKTDVPSWLPNIALNWGLPEFGTPSADEWKTMTMVYFPIALILSWDGEQASREGRHRRQLLDLTMCLVQATWLACTRSISKAGRASYLKCMCTYVHNLELVCEGVEFKPNHHFAIHIYEFLDMWGPVYSWWCFPFERINGLLQRISTNNIFGQLEITLATVFARRANLKRWIFNQVYPEMGLFRKAMDKAMDNQVDLSDKENKELDLHIDEMVSDGTKSIERAHYRHNGVIYSRAETHPGNSVVCFKKNGNVFYGSIKRLRVLPLGPVQAEISHYTDLPAGHHDPFIRYAPHFPVKLLSTKEGKAEFVDFSAIKCHCARFRVSDESVVLVELSRESMT